MAAGAESRSCFGRMSRRREIHERGRSTVVMTVLELDHVFCMVTDPGHAAQRLLDDGWVLDAGQAHRGQGTRNRRLWWPEQFFELLWVTDPAEARSSPVRLDRRADWATTGASPFGLAFRGQVAPPLSAEFWLYEALGRRILIDRDNERVPERPLVFVLDAAEEEMEGAPARGPDLRARQASPSGRAARSARPWPVRAFLAAVHGTLDRLHAGPAPARVGRGPRRLRPASQRRLDHSLVAAGSQRRGRVHRMTTSIEVVDRGRLVAFSVDDVMRYHGPGSPGGVAHAVKVLELALPLLDPDGPCERREIVVETAFGGPGARDALSWSRVPSPAAAIASTARSRVPSAAERSSASYFG